MTGKAVALNINVIAINCDAPAKTNTDILMTNQNDKSRLVAKAPYTTAKGAAEITNDKVSLAPR